MRCISRKTHCIYALRVGDLRLRISKPLTPLTGTIDATAFGNQCIQQPLPLPSDAPLELLLDLALVVPFFSPNPLVPQAEDCE